MNGKQYQIRDIMDKFYISRDMVKYFEEKGLISSQRNESGYRVYEEVDLQKVKCILDLRELGYSYEEIKQFAFQNDLETETTLLKKLREETEKQVKQLNDRLYKMHLYERWLYENHSFFDTIKMDTGFRICVPNDTSYTTGSVKEFMARDMKYAQFSGGGYNELIFFWEDKKAVLLRGRMWSRKCGDCKKGKRIEYETVFRGIRICSSMEELEQFVEEIHEKALVLGYHPRNEAFCIERAIRKKEKDYIAFDVCVPVEE